MRRCLITVLAVALWLPSVGIMTTAHGAPTAPVAKAELLTTTLSTGSSAVVTSRGTRLELQVNISPVRAQLNQPAYTDIAVLLETETAYEGHSYTFRLPVRAFRRTGTSGNVSATSSALSGYGQAKLTFSSAGKTQRAGCATSYVLTTPVTIKGRFAFDTKSTGAKRWGKVGSNSKRTVFKGATLNRIYGTAAGGGCTESTAACGGDIGWSASQKIGTDGQEAFQGGGPPAAIIATRQVVLSKTASRFDEVSAAAPEPVLKPAGQFHVLVIKTKEGSGFSGTANLLETSLFSVSTQPCEANGKKFLEIHLGFNGSLTSTIIAREQVFGAFRVAKSDDGFITVTDTVPWTG